MKVVSARGLSKRYHLGEKKTKSIRDSIMGAVRRSSGAGRTELWALNDVSFDANDGESIGIIGRNGAGKSTLLKIISRITKPTRGTATIRGRVGSLLEVGTGFHNELTGRENIFLNGAILGMRRAEIEKKFDEIVAFSEIGKFIDTTVKHYSSGMYMRLAFSVAAHLEPEVLIVDEVLAVGDMEFQKKCLGKMDEVSRSGRTVLFVSHNLGSLAQICQRGILLHEGELRADGTINEAIDAYLSLSQAENQFAVAELDDAKHMQITKAYVTDRSGRVTYEIPHDQEICLHFKVRVNHLPKGAFYCVALLNKYKERIFSEIKPVEEFKPERGRDISFRYEIPGNLIAPNDYSFHLSVYYTTGGFVDNVMDVCPFSVVDMGTELAIYRDYGYVQMHADWQMTEE